jgi:hypothetical protein
VVWGGGLVVFGGGGGGGGGRVVNPPPAVVAGGGTGLGEGFLVGFLVGFFEGLGEGLGEGEGVGLGVGDPVAANPVGRFEGGVLCAGLAAITISSPASTVTVPRTFIQLRVVFSPIHTSTPPTTARTGMTISRREDGMDASRYLARLAADSRVGELVRRAAR